MTIRTLLTVSVLAVAALAVATGAIAEDRPAVPQRNLVTFFDRCRAGGEVTVAYFGGSITAQNGWRPFTTSWLKQQFPGLKVNEVNAAIGGTGSMLGAYRLDKHVLSHSPDLVFVEFAVNDNGGPDDSVKATMEGIVRQIWSRPKKADIVFVYTTAHTLEIPTARHQAVADAYGIPTVDFQKSIRALCVPGLIEWKILDADTVHPNDWGHAIYAATLATYLSKQIALKEAVPPPATLPPAVFNDLYSTASLMPVTANAPEGWEVIKPAGTFGDGAILTKEVGKSVEFKFVGTQVGLFYEMLKDAGIVACEIDGKKVRDIDTSWGPTYKFNRQNMSIIAEGLAKGEHVLKITMTEKSHELSAGHEFKLGYLLVAG